jgi:hypothetical protein
MPAADLVATTQGRFSLVLAELSGEAYTLGVLLEDPSTDSLHIRLRRDWESFASEEDTEVLELLGDQLVQYAREMGAAGLFQKLEADLSQTIRITDRREVLVEDFDRALNRLYREHVPSKVLQFKTHVPRYTLRVAAGIFLDNAPAEVDDWVEAPDGLRITPDLFAAPIAGHSMEPVIPGGSLCLFRFGVTGSRQGRLVLVEDPTSGGQNQYTVKRYSSEKRETDSGWAHTRIHLESLNPGYPSWDLDPEENKYRIVAEFVRVLE